MSSLQQIILQRHDTLESEPYPHIVWWACLIDISAQLSGRRGGALVAELARQNAVPHAEAMWHVDSFLVAPVQSPEGGPAGSANEVTRALGNAAWRLHRASALGANTVGSVAGAMRERVASQDGVVRAEQARAWASEGDALRRMIMNNWSRRTAEEDPNGQLAAAVQSGQVQDIVRDVYDHVSLASCPCFSPGHGLEG